MAPWSVAARAALAYAGRVALVSAHRPALASASRVVPVPFADRVALVSARRIATAAGVTHGIGGPSRDVCVRARSYCVVYAAVQRSRRSLVARRGIALPFVRTN